MAILSQATRTILNGEDLTASTNYSYTSSGDTGADAGWYDAKYNEIVVQIGVATLNATSFDYRIEGRANANARALELYSTSINAITNIDTSIKVTEKVNQMRVGHKVSTNATPNNIYSRLILTEVT